MSAEIEQKTSAEVAVVTVRDLGGGSIDDYASRLFEKWGIGKKGKDNGVMLIAAIDDRKVRIEVGYGLEGILPDGKCGEILDTYVLPRFKAGDYGKGLAAGAAEIARAIAKDAGVELTGQYLNEYPPAPQRSFLFSIMKIIFFIILFIIFVRHPFLFLLFFGSGGFGGGSSRGGFGGGFGGFGGGMSGGGGASRGW
jgi:uncharacterized protein